MQGSDRYTIISADCHAGASMDAYVEYLDPAWREEFEAWRAKYKNPFRDLQSGGKTRNWDDEVRNGDLDGQGIAGEIVFPNTVPPFFPTGQLIAYPPKNAEQYERRMAGIRAHNRWLVDWCARHPTRRAGLAQVFLNDVDDAVAEATWAAEAGLAGILVPAIPPDLGIPEFYTDAYDPLWDVCADAGLVVNQHGGSGLPSYSKTPIIPFLMLMEVPFFANRSLWHLVLGGIFERFPRLAFVFTEQGVGWVPEALARMDSFHDQMASLGRVGELKASDSLLPRRPSEYVQDNIFFGASFPSPGEAKAMRKIGIDRVMWGADYPHAEGCQPHTLQALQRAFAGWTPEELVPVLGGNAAGVFGLDMDLLAPLAAKIGPTVDEVATPLTKLPDNSSPAFSRA